MHRVVVIGCSGAGKSTFSMRLAALTGLPLVSLDAEHWQPGWVEPQPAAWRAKVAGLAARDAWIMDGNYGGTFDLRLPRADTAIWFDYPRHVCLRRVLWRIATSYGQVRPEMAPGCPEQLDLGFLHYVWSFDAKVRPSIGRALAAHGPHLSPVIFRRDADVARFLDKLAGGATDKAR